MWIKSRITKSLKFLKLQNGLSIIELILAISITTIIVASAVATVLGSFSSGRLAKEELYATTLSHEGFSAVESLRNQDWANLTAGTYGLALSGGNWSLTGTPDVDASGRFTRTVTIQAIQRDGAGLIVASGGTVDPDSFLVEVDVTWDFTPTRSNSVAATNLYTNWQLTTGQGSGTAPSTTCAEYCIDQAYSTGTCRQNNNQCGLNGETYEAGGDIYCNGGANSDTCCCAP